MFSSQERLLSLREAARRLPGRPHISTLHRWRTKGVRGVRLETCLVGGRRYTSLEALQRFIEASEAETDGQTHRGGLTPSQRQRSLAAVESGLEQALARRGAGLRRQDTTSDQSRFIRNTLEEA